MTTEERCEHGSPALVVCTTVGCEQGRFVCIEQAQCQKCRKEHVGCQLKNWQQVKKQLGELAKEENTRLRAILWLVRWLHRITEKLRQWQHCLEEKAEQITETSIKERLLTGKMGRTKPNIVWVGVRYLLWLFLAASVIFLIFRILSPNSEKAGLPDVHLDSFNSTTHNASLVATQNDQQQCQLPVSPSKQTPNFELTSSITTDAALIASFFPSKTIDSARLLFRASEHSFMIDLFHHYCDGYSDVLLLALNEYDKVFGAYSPLQFKADLGFEHTEDPSCSTFLFSVSNRQKFPLLLSQKSNALYNDAEWGPSYGSGCDLRISNEAHKNKQSYSRFPSSFYSLEYRDPAVARYRFIGSIFEEGFRLKEWEVFHLKFADG